MGFDESLGDLGWGHSHILMSVLGYNCASLGREGVFCGFREDCDTPLLYTEAVVTWLTMLRGCTHDLFNSSDARSLVLTAAYSFSASMQGLRLLIDKAGDRPPVLTT